MDESSAEITGKDEFELERSTGGCCLTTAAATRPEPDPGPEGGDGVNNGADNDEELKGPVVSFFTALELEVLKIFIANYSATKTLSREDCVRLDYVFGPVFEKCLKMIDEERLEIKRGSVSGRVLVQVFGESGGIYWIAPGNAICQCLDFKNSDKDYCKHILAAHLYLAITPKENYVRASESELSQAFTACEF